MSSARIKWRDRTPENDIKYGGHLSYRHLRIIGWFCLVIAQIGVVLKLEAKLAPATAGTVNTWMTVISIIGSLPIPLFLLANMSTILQKRGNYKALFIKFGALAAGMYLLANFIVFHYGFRTMLAFDNTVNWGDAARAFGEMLPFLGKTGYTLNIFIDMLLVVLMFFFMNYEPRVKAFEGKRIILFRLLILLPVAYEVAGIVLKYFAYMADSFIIPSPLFFLLPSKPPLVFAAFFFIVLFLKLAEVRWLRRPGNTKEAYEVHITTKAHSLKISILIAVIFAILAVADLALYLGLAISAMYAIPAQYPDYAPEVLETMIAYKLEVYEAIGFGGATALILAIPLVILFSYTKTHKNPKIDIFIPIIGIAGIAIVLLEGFFQVITLNLPAFLDKIRNAIAKILGDDTGGEPAAQGLTEIISHIKDIHLL